MTNHKQGAVETLGSSLSRMNTLRKILFGHSFICVNRLMVIYVQISGEFMYITRESGIGNRVSILSFIILLI